MQIEAGPAVLTGKAMFTQAGEELFRISDPQIVEGFFEYAAEEWKDHLKQSP